MNFISNETETSGHGSPVCHQLQFSSSENDIIPPVVQASIDTNTGTLNLRVANYNYAVIGKSNTVRDCDYRLLGKKKKEADLEQKNSKGEQTPRVTAVCNHFQPYHKDLQVSKEESQQNRNTLSGEILADVEPSLPLIKKQGFLNGPQCENILESLELLQDNGNFEHHKRMFNFCLQRCVNKENTHMEVMGEEKQSPIGEQCKQVLKRFQLFQDKGKLQKDENLLSLFSRLCTKRENADMVLALVIEQGVSFMYHNEYSKSKLYFTSVIELGKYCQLRNPNILIARAYFLLAANYRYKKTKNVSVILECLRRSETLLQNHESPEDWAEMYYILGSVWLAYMSMIPDDKRNAHARSETREKVKRYYELAIAICKEDTRSRVQLKKQTYCHLGLAALLLDCTSTAARTHTKVIPQQDIKDAIKHLDIVQYELGETVPRGTFVQILKTRSDQYYRQGSGMYQLAKETAQEALRIARCHGFNTELDSLQERIDFLDQLCEEAQCKEKITLLSDGYTSTSGSDSRFEMSCSEPDTIQETADPHRTNKPAISDI